MKINLYKIIDLSKSGVFSIENYRHLQHRYILFKFIILKKSNKLFFNKISDMMMVENANGRRIEVPRGMYHYTEQNNEIDSNYRLPTLNTDDDEIEARSFMMDLLRGGTTKTSTNDNEMMGIYIPMPIQPINIQVLFMQKSVISQNLADGLKLLLNDIGSRSENI